MNYAILHYAPEERALDQLRRNCGSYVGICTATP
jgi:hypothetical protein